MRGLGAPHVRRERVAPGWCVSGGRGGVGCGGRTGRTYLCAAIGAARLQGKVLCRRVACVVAARVCLCVDTLRVCVRVCVCVCVCLFDEFGARYFVAYVNSVAVARIGVR